MNRMRNNEKGQQQGTKKQWKMSARWGVVSSLLVLVSTCCIMIRSTDAIRENPTPLFLLNQRQQHQKHKLLLKKHVLLLQKDINMDRQQEGEDLLYLKLRGGADESDYDEEEEDDEISLKSSSPSLSSSSAVMTKLRNIIRSLLDIGEQKLPSAINPVKSLLKTLEGILGVELLPKEEIVASKKKKTSKSKKSKKSKKKKKEAQEEGDDDDTATAEKKKKAKAKKPTAATAKHLNTQMKTTNPNYRIQKELKAFIKDPPPNLSVKVGKNIRVWIVTMVGAKNSIYEGETFKLRVSFPTQYPTMPPSVYFLPPNIPKHEHVYTNGDICLSLLGKDWRPTMTAQSIANSILSILSSAQSKSIPMDNAKHAQNKPGQYQQDWVYHDDNC